MKWIIFRTELSIYGGTALICTVLAVKEVPYFIISIVMLLLMVAFRLYIYGNILPPKE